MRKIFRYFYKNIRPIIFLLLCPAFIFFWAIHGTNKEGIMPAITFFIFWTPQAIWIVFDLTIMDNQVLRKD